MDRVELLAPAGSYETALSALNAGADAIYLGGMDFGARAGAENLTTEEIIDVLNYAHINGRKVYLTVNTLLKDREIEDELFSFLEPLYSNGLDAVIVQDIGVLIFIKNSLPKLKIHASTQMTVFGKYTVEILKKMGVERIVTPRELSLDEISNIRKSDGEIEIESFVHGALCYCYSGQCLLSSFIGGRSGNRGTCAQPCRLPYDVFSYGKQINPDDEKYVLSPKDICAIKLLPDIIESGVNSLKIEGRMKKKEYVAGVVSIYRKYLDMYLAGKKYSVDEADIKLLMDLFNRNGFSESYFKQHNGRDMISLNEPSFRIENESFIKEINEKFTGKTLKRDIDISVKCVEDSPFTLSSSVDGKEVEVSHKMPKLAKKHPLTEGILASQLTKTGNTNFNVNNLDFTLDDGLFLTVKDINEARRLLIKKVEQELLNSFKRDDASEVQYFKRRYEPNTYHYGREYPISVSVTFESQLELALEQDFISRLYIDMDFISEECIKDAFEYKGVEIYLALPYVARKKDIEQLSSQLDLIREADGVLVRNIEQYYYLKDKGVVKNFVFDYNVYANNKFAKGFYNTDSNVTTTVPLELNFKELKYRGCYDEEMIIYGHIPTMISANCGLKTFGKCIKNSSMFYLKDRLNNKFPVKCNCKHCYNIMYNCNALSLFNYYDKLVNLNPISIRINFTIEDEEAVERILYKVKSRFVFNDEVHDAKNTTRGHFTRGVQ